MLLSIFDHLAQITPRSERGRPCVCFCFPYSDSGTSADARKALFRSFKRLIIK